MAITKIKKIKKRLDHVIDYTTNPSKTSKENYSDLHNVIEYTKASYKTEEQLYVTALNCDQETIYEDMMRTKRRFSKTDGILGFHVIQSFKENEVTPELAHSIGVQLANELWSDKYEVIITTHLNTNHIHNHFCFNSVSYIDGKKYHDCNETYALIRETSDRICEENRLSVIDEKKCPKSKINYNNFYKGQAQKSSYNMIVKEDIDYAIAQAFSYNDFLSILRKMDYTITNRYGKLSVRKEPYKRNIRIERAFGDEYKIENIEKKIYETQATKEPFPEARAEPKRYKMLKKQNIKNKKKAKGIKALYLHYCFLLKVYPKKYNKKIIYSKEMKEEIKKMDKISNEVRLLCRKDIETVQELLAYKKSLTLDKKEYKTKVENLWRKNKKAKSENEKQEIYSEIKLLQNEIKKLNEEIELVEDIETRIPKMKEKVDELEYKNQEKEKEKQNSEYIK